MEEDGVAPPEAMPSDLQSDPLLSTVYSSTCRHGLEYLDELTLRHSTVRHLFVLFEQVRITVSNLQSQQIHFTAVSVNVEENCTNFVGSPNLTPAFVAHETYCFTF